MMEDEKGNFTPALMKEKSGTKPYIAPEIQHKNSHVGPEIDIWAFGIVLYELCVAYKPTQLRNYKYGSGPIPFRARDWSHLSHQGEIVQDLINRCLQMEPS